VGGKAIRTLGVWQGSAAQQTRELVPDGVSVVAAFHTVSAALLTDLEHTLDEDVLMCGNRKEDKARVAALVDGIEGLRAVDCGRLEMAHIVEQLTALIIGINVRHKAQAGIRITGLKSAGGAGGSEAFSYARGCACALRKAAKSSGSATPTSVTGGPWAGARSWTSRSRNNVSILWM
jgi:hypothetical protein